MLFINFKTYKQGREAVKLAKIIEKIRKDAFVCVESTDIHEIVKKTKLKVYAQHVDYEKPGRHTGKTLPEAIKAEGAEGSLLNHSENKISITEIKRTIERCNKIGIKVLCCASTINKVKQIKKFNPYGIAFEDPKLISTGRSISKYNPKAIKKFVEIMGDSKILRICGAGISTHSDIIKVEEMGCHGVLIASAVTKSNSVKKIRSILT